jgi:hypothetical protein
MPDDSTFTQFIGRIRAGDEQAATDLVQRFEPVIRLEVRMAIRDPRLNRVLDWIFANRSWLAFSCGRRRANMTWTIPNN